MLVGAEVVDPELLGPGRFGCRLFVEEQDIRLHALRVEQARGQAQERMHVALVQELSPDRLPCPAFEQDVIRHDNCRAAVLFQKGLYMLDEIELLIGCRGPEVLALDDIGLP